jgi:hypothetical protein
MLSCNLSIKRWEVSHLGGQVARFVSYYDAVIYMAKLDPTIKEFDWWPEVKDRGAQFKIHDTSRTLTQGANDEDIQEEVD